MLSYVEAYKNAGNALTLDETISKVWLEGVIGVNKRVGGQSDFIRNYNSLQKELRFGEEITTEQLDRASDNIALDVIDRIINAENLPTVDFLAGVDVATVIKWRGCRCVCINPYDRLYARSWPICQS